MKQRLSRECVNCEYHAGIGSDVWCEHKPKGKTAYMCETDCKYFKLWSHHSSEEYTVKTREQIINDKDKYKIMQICDKLIESDFAKRYKSKNKHTILLKINNEDDDIDYDAINHIASKFRELGYKINVCNAYWMEIIFGDTLDRINECFEV